MTSLKTILTVVFQSNTGNVILWNAWDPEPDPKWGRFQDRDLKGSTTLPWGMRHSTFITLVTNCRDLSGVAQRMRNSGYPHLSRLLPTAGICLKLHSACATAVILIYHVWVVTTRRDLSGVAQHMRNSGYPHLSRLLPPPEICLELYSACATGVLSTFITLVTLSGVVQCMRNRHYSQLSRLLPPAGICL